MSVVNVERTNHCASQQEHMIELPTSIREKLNTVVRQHWRAELMHRVSVVAVAGLLAIIGLIVADVLFGFRSAPMRWTIWVAGLGITCGAIRYCLVKPPHPNQQLLDAAWKIESSHPGMEERLTSTVQFLNEDSRQNSSYQLIEALVTETSQGVGHIDAEAIPNPSSQIPVALAAVLATAVVCSAALWPQTVLTSLSNLATPWSPYAVPTLSVNIAPGDVTIVEGESISIEVFTSDALDHPTLEIIRDEVIESHAMVATSPEVSTCTLMDVRQDAVYRIHSDGLYSASHTITVHPQPRLKAISGRLKFPDYTHLEPLTIDQMIEPIEVPVGTKVTLTAVSDNVAVAAAIRWNAEPQEIIARKVTDHGSTESVQFEWTFRIEPERDLIGTAEVRSEHGVGSVPLPIEIRALDDTSPRIEITTPGLRQLSMRRDNDLPIRYRVFDDFGFSTTELMVMLGKQEPVARSCPAPEEQPGEQRVWIGATSLDLRDIPADCQELSLWLRVADNRPDEFGGPQAIESEQIHITLDDRADSLGQQQVLADRQMIDQSLQQAIEQMQEGLAASEALQNDPSETEDPNRNGRQEQPLATNDLTGNPGHPRSRTDHIDALRQQTLKAKQTLDQLAKKLQDRPSLFQPKAAEIQRLSDREVTEALEQANQIPLADDQPQQNNLARGSGLKLAAAIDQLKNLKSEVKQQAEQLEQAARLDQLASKQGRLARKAAKGDRTGTPDEQWRDRQEEVADELQSLVEENTKALRQQLLQRAEDAEHLAQQAQQLGHQQQQLERAMREAQQNGGKADKAKKQLQNLIAAQKAEVDQQAKQGDQLPDGQPEPVDHQEKQQQRLKEAALAAQEGDLDKATAKIQEQIADRAEKIQQQAEQLAKQENPEPAVQERAKQAAEQLRQAQKDAEQAKQSLCEKCNGGGKNRSNDQNKPGDQKSNPDGQKQGAKSQEQNAQQQQQGAAQPKNTGQQEQTPKRDDAEINRDQQEAARSLQEAAQSLNQVCKSCRECANGNKPGSTGGSKRGSSQISSSPKNGSPKNGLSKNGSPKGDSPGGRPSAAKQLAKASDGAKQAARSPTNEEAAQNAESVAEHLNQLADEAAQKSGYSLRQQRGTPEEQDKQQATGNKPDNNARSGQPGQASANPKGVGKATGDRNVNGPKIRGETSSNWARSRRKLDGGVLDDERGNVPEQYRGVVKRYFEELSRQQSNREE